MQLTDLDRAALIQDIASRRKNARALAAQYSATISELRDFTVANLAEIEAARTALENGSENDATVTPAQLNDLWITKKFERLQRLEAVADLTYKRIQSDQFVGSDYATIIREFRSYMLQAANELGQLLHRGAGDVGSGDMLSVDIQGVDMGSLR